MTAIETIVQYDAVLHRAFGSASTVETVHLETTMHPTFIDRLAALPQRELSRSPGAALLDNEDLFERPQLGP